MIGAGRSFIAGADIRQFGKPRPAPKRPVPDVLDASSKPVVAAIHGYALGGGLEHALACHYRIAAPSAKVGLPEVLIGILPGGGGTQRLPRLIGPKRALEMILSGRHVPAEEAKALGIIDAIVPGKDLRSEAIAWAERMADRRPLPRLRDKTDRLQEAKADPGMFDAMRTSIARKARNQKAPYHCILCVEAAVNEPFDEGIATERRLFAELENSEEAKALRYAFFAEREVAKLPWLAKDLALPEIKTAAVVGAGTMGGGIAMSFADHGFPVKLLDASPEVLAKGMQRIRANYATSVRRGSLTQAEMERRLALLEPVESFAAIADCDAVIEAVFEEMPVKQEVFAQLDKVMKPGALMFSNTSALDIDEIASVTKRPEAVAGTHFFVPANVMKTFEVVHGAKTSPATLAAAMKLGRDIGKISAFAGNCDGFVANRTRIPFNLEQGLMVEEGALPEQVDRVMVAFGYPVARSRSTICRAWTSATPPASAAPRPIPTIAACRSRTGWWRWGGWVRRRARAGIAIRTTTAPPSLTPKWPRSSRRWLANSASCRGVSRTRKFCTACCFPPSMKPARFCKKARRSAPAISM